MNGTKVEWELSRHLRERERERIAVQFAGYHDRHTTITQRGYNNDFTNSKIFPKTCLHHPKNGNNVNHSIPFTKREWLRWLGPSYITIRVINFIYNVLFSPLIQRCRYDFDIIGINMEKLSLMAVDGMNKQYSVCALVPANLSRRCSVTNFPTSQRL